MCFTEIRIVNISGAWIAWLSMGMGLPYESHKMWQRTWSLAHVQLSVIIRHIAEMFWSWIALWYAHNAVWYSAIAWRYEISENKLGISDAATKQRAFQFSLEPLTRQFAVI